MAELLKPEFLDEVCQVVKMLGHPARIKIIEHLENGPATVGQLQQTIGLSQPVTSQHLRLMKDKGILSSQRDGNIIRYSVKNPITLKFLNCLRNSQLEQE
jgi:DNA-binding transcriptional ArsR family regulator